MKTTATLVALAAAMLGGDAFAQPAGSAALPKIAVIGLVHSHVWGHLGTMVAGKSVQLVGVSEPNAELVAEAQKAGVAPSLFYPDYKKMLEETKPDIVWAFVENNRHLEIAEACAPRHVNLIFEKPLASTYNDARKIEALSRKYDVRVMTNYQMAWWPANYVAKAAVDRGDLGSVYRLHGVVGHGGPGSEGPRNQFFFAWLTDPAKNGAGALMDFGCYNVLWSLWYLGMPQTIYASANHLRPDRYPRVEDNATLVLNYPNAVGVFEGSWNLPRSFQDLEVFGRAGSLYMRRAGVELNQGRGKVSDLPVTALDPDESEPVAYMVSRLRSGKPIEGLTAVGINVKVIHLIDLAKESIRMNRAVSAPQDEHP